MNKKNNSLKYSKETVNFWWQKILWTTQFYFQLKNLALIKDLNYQTLKILKNRLKQETELFHQIPMKSITLELLTICNYGINLKSLKTFTNQTFKIAQILKWFPVSNHLDIRADFYNLFVKIFWFRSYNLFNKYLCEWYYILNTKNKISF